MSMFTGMLLTEVDSRYHHRRFSHGIDRCTNNGSSGLLATSSTC